MEYVKFGRTQALDLGINFFDTANVYSDGTSEEIVGRALKDFTCRDEIVLATKVKNRMRRGPNGKGLSRKAILGEIDNSLRRLGTDFVDLYQIPRADEDIRARGAGRQGQPFRSPCPRAPRRSGGTCPYHAAAP